LGIFLFSDDGGKTVLNKNEKINTAMEECAKILNIKPHKSNTGVIISAPIDIEVHQGYDGIFYVLFDCFVILLL
jgi:hypothetical protein